MKVKKERVTKYLKGIESLVHKMIDEGKDQNFTAYELIFLTLDTIIKEKQMDEIEKYKKAGNS